MTDTRFNKDPYKILQVDPAAEAEVIAAAYRSLAKRYHPDANPGPDANERMKEINWAYSLLGDPQKRKEYDRRFSDSTQSSPPSRPPGQSVPSSSKIDEEIASWVIYEAMRRQGITCQGCGDVAPTRKVHFGRNVGMLFMRRIFEVEGLFCRRCIEEKFWEFNGKLLLLGWWGTISFFATWYYLIANLFTYLRSLTLDSNVDGLWKTAIGWKLTNFAVTGLVVLVIGVNIDANRPGLAMIPTPTTHPVAASLATPSVSQNSNILRPTSRPTSKPLFTPTSDCMNWQQVTLGHVGRTICVTGTVASTYTDVNYSFPTPVPIFYITFGIGSGHFYMVDYNGYFDHLNGNCVRATGKIESAGTSPYMVIENHRLDICK